MSYRLGRRSRARLAGVHPDLVRVVEEAIQRTPVDFTVLEGLRTRERQAALVAAGASQTMNSRHLTGHAVDLGAMVGSEVRWDMNLYYSIAAAMRDAARLMAIPLRWGGCWLRLDTAILTPAQLVGEYAASRRLAGKRPFIDAGHFELGGSYA